MNFGGGGYQSVGDSFGGGGGGGGYMPGVGVGGYGSPSVIQSPGVDNRKRAPKNQSIRPVTSALLRTAVQPVGEEAFKIDGEDIGQIALVGEIIEVNETATNIVYRIDDRTGPLIEVRRWVDDAESPLELQRRAACREGIYVKVIGHLRMFNKQQNVIGFFIKPIEDFNEVTHHLTETIYAHLAITKCLSLPKGFEQAHHQEGGVGGGGWNPTATSTQIGSYRGGVGGGLEPVQRQVLSIIGGCGSEQGMHIGDISTQARNYGFSEVSIKNAIDFLSNEGHIYSTIDDDHFKSTEEF